MPIGRDRYVRERQAIRKIEHGGKPAVTLYEVLETFTRTAAERPTGTEPVARGATERRVDSARRQRVEHYALMEFTPKTGRTHQIRVHAAALGLPLVGDTMYGGRIFEPADGSFRFDRQALHAARITFVHPGTRQSMTLTAPLPPDMTRLIEILRQG
jgi:23S rRNA-/tRNA-specific pseudouridylate synthase